MFDEETEKNLMMGAGIAVEYTLDSPMFRQQLYAIEHSYAGIGNYVEGVTAALRDVHGALGILQAAQTRLIDRLLGRPVDSASSSGNSAGGSGGNATSFASPRCLFTNAFPELGDLAQNIHHLADMLRGINSVYISCSNNLIEESEVLLRKLSKDHLVQARGMKVVMEELGSVYESKLSAMLSSREKASPAAEADIMEARSNYELARFDVVAKVNENDRNKKVILTQVACDIYYTFRTVFSECMRQVESKEAYFNKIQTRAVEVSQQLPVLAHAWASVRVRLAGELAGALPAPGSPAGSLSPVNPRNHQGMPPYTAVITTEVLSNSTRSASHYDRRHARDDGVYKQGYLYSYSQWLRKRKRKWHRLYSNKLYTMAFKPSGGAGSGSSSGVGSKADAFDESFSCTMTLVADVSLCSVISKPGSIPYCFVVVPQSGIKLEFQAENEDEMILWITAIRRCALAAPGRPKPPDALLATLPASASETSAASGAEGGAAQGGTSGDSNNNSNSNSSSDALGENTDSDSDSSFEQGGEVADIATSSTTRMYLSPAHIRAHRQVKGDYSMRFNQALALSKLHSKTKAPSGGFLSSTPTASMLPEPPAADLERFQRSEDKLIAFLSQNDRCAECTSPELVKWVSVSLGVTLCETCAAAHRQLTWSVSKLKSIEYDDFPDWQVSMLHGSLSNDAVNSIWEKNVPEGWTKPSPTSSVELKTNWVLAKYKWYAFVEELRISSKEYLVEGFFDAVREGVVHDLMWWLSLKADVNCLNIDKYAHQTPLHIAVQRGDPSIVAFLLLNGADLYAVDDDGYTALDISSEIASKSATLSGSSSSSDGDNRVFIQYMLDQVQRGEY